jgi:hypothetical protein
MGGVPSTSRLALAVCNQEFECMTQEKYQQDAACNRIYYSKVY